MLNKCSSHRLDRVYSMVHLERPDGNQAGEQLPYHKINLDSLNRLYFD